MRKPAPPRPSQPDGQDVTGPIDLDARKERVLHTRVPASLDRHIKQRARSLGTSVSTVVRNVLLNTFGLVESIVTDSANIALSITGEEAIPAPTDAHARGGAPEGEDACAASGILGWQEAVLNLNTVCDRCNAILHRGSRAAIAVRERQGPRTILCRRCLSRLAGGAGNGGGRRARRR